MRAELQALENAVGHHFADREILRRALTHSSHVHEGILTGIAEPPRDNEQLEFLGDAVLGCLISEELVRRFSDYSEGRLSKLKAHLVSAAYLFEVAQKLGLGVYLQLGRGEEMSGGRSKKTLLVDALEALIAALYLDGGIEAARGFVHHWVLEPAQSELARVAERMPDAMVDFKSALQELAQARKLPQPRYVIVRERGPEHSKTFTIEVRVGREFVSQAEGLTKKSAAQKAAREVYERILSLTGGDAV